MGSTEQPVKVKTPTVAIVGRNTKTRDELKLVLADGLRAEFGDVHFLSRDLSFLGRVGASSQLVVLDLQTWMPSDELALSELRVGGYQGPVVVLTKRDTAVVDYVQDRVIFFDRGKSDSEFIGIARRMLAGLTTPPRKYTRHVTNETAEVQLAGAEATHVCRLRNISKGGACLELDQTISLNIGDLIAVRVNLRELNRFYEVRARVTWVKDSGFGVEFMAGKP